MPNLSDTAFCFDRNAAATTLHVVRAADYARWAEEQPPAIKRWLASTQHRGDAGTLAWLPDDAAPSVLAVVGSLPWSAATINSFDPAISTGVSSCSAKCSRPSD